MAKKIMIVDDDKVFLEEFTEMLKTADYDVISTNDSTAAVKLARKQKPDVILLDHIMRPKRGFQISYELKNYPETSQIPVIMITGKELWGGQHFLMDYCGIKRCLSKPFYPLDALSAIEAA